MPVTYLWPWSIRKNYSCNTSVCTRNYVRRKLVTTVFKGLKDTLISGVLLLKDKLILNTQEAALLYIAFNVLMSFDSAEARPGGHR